MDRTLITQCPKCNRRLNVPNALDKVFCTYCGEKIVISRIGAKPERPRGSIKKAAPPTKGRKTTAGPKDRPPKPSSKTTSSTTSKKTAPQNDKIMNLYELGLRAYNVKDYDGAIEQLEEALELDLDNDRVNDLLTKSYYGMAFVYLERAKEKRALAEQEERYARNSGVSPMGSGEHRDIHRQMDDISDQLENVHKSRASMYMDQVKELENKAKIYLKKAGICPECYGTRNCHYCSGTGYCYKCGGSGTEYLIATCSICNGYKLCTACRGWRGCTFCKATGKYLRGGQP